MRFLNEYLSFHSMVAAEVSYFDETFASSEENEVFLNIDSFQHIHWRYPAVFPIFPPLHLTRLTSLSDQRPSDLFLRLIDGKKYAETSMMLPIDLSLIV